MSARRAAMAAGILALAAPTASVRAQPDQPHPETFCARVGTDDALRALPPGLAEAVRLRFGLGAVPAPVIARGAVWRCFEGRALVCFAGADLPCGKLDARTDLPAADGWCEQHADAAIPAVVIGHDSRWRWRCEGPRAVHDGQAWHPDQRGFARETWRPLTARQ